MSMLAGITTVAKTKAAAGLAVAALAAGGTAAAAAPSSERSADGQRQSNAQAFGQKVVAQVATCKAALPSGEHGIGKCVSAWAKNHNHGAAHRHKGDSKADVNGRADNTDSSAKGTEGKSDASGHGASASHRSTTEGKSDATRGAPVTPGESDATHGEPASPGQSGSHRK
ncbi:MAG: hypothetical protein ABR598_09335 [Candidatus Dormibacteria bacterium]